VILSVVIITHNEETNIGRTLASVQPLVADGKGEIIVVDSGSTDRTVEIAKSYGAKVFVEEWKGYAAQKNSAIDKAEGDWILSLDADEELSDELPAGATGFSIPEFLETVDSNRGKTENWKPYPVHLNSFRFHRRNYFLGRWIKRGGFWPDPKIRLFKRGTGRFEERTVHESLKVEGITFPIGPDIIHHSYPTLADYLDHMNRYSSLGAEMIVAKGPVRFSVFNIVVRPAATFIYNYFFRLGFLDGREGLLLHLYHAVYVSWKYAKAWELARQKPATH
jgi:glycosyltransferase involved in cell wall biosynthesis